MADRKIKWDVGMMVRAQMHSAEMYEMLKTAGDCPSCHYSEGHEEDCKLQALLRDIDGEMG